MFKKKHYVEHFYSITSQLLGKIRGFRDQSNDQSGFSDVYCLNFRQFYNILFIHLTYKAINKLHTSETIKLRYFNKVSLQFHKGLGLVRIIKKKKCIFLKYNILETFSENLQYIQQILFELFENQRGFLGRSRMFV